MISCCEVQSPKAAVMIDAVAPRDQIRRAYNFYSYFYSRLVAPLEQRPRMRGLELAEIRPGDKVIEVAVGPGATFLEILKKVGRETTVYGADLSPKMLGETRRRAHAAGHTNIELREADARDLPFQDSTFDVLYNSFMLDLIPLDDMALVLSEFLRVLKPGGRLVLVNLSKRDEKSNSWWERLYSGLPRSWVPYVLGGCRPVLMEPVVRRAGFSEVTREFVWGVLPSEVVSAKKLAIEDSWPEAIPERTKVTKR